jgi:hypothetical protein
VATFFTIYYESYNADAVYIHTHIDKYVCEMYTMAHMNNPDVMIIHDDIEILSTLYMSLTIKYDMNILSLNSLQTGVNMLHQGFAPKVILAHKGDNDIKKFIDAIRSIEGGETIRVGFMSGEFYGEHVCQTALELGADFGWDTTIGGIDNEIPEWVYSMIELGYCHPEEIALRGQDIVVSARDARRRMELIGRTNRKEQW